MSYRVRLLANAQRDLGDIEKYFDSKAPHETVRCLDAIEAALDWIADHAHQPPAGRFALRRINTAPFRYHVWYRLFQQERYVQVVAILHHRRGEASLTERLP